MSEQRRLSTIAREISDNWTNPYFGAVPYIAAMKEMSGVRDPYGLDSGESIVYYFLSNARNWRGEAARRIKAELNDMLIVAQRGDI